MDSNKSIYTLVPDIEDYINQTEDWYEQVSLDNYRRQADRRMLPDIGGSSNKRTSLRLSALGDKCPRQLWYSIHRPELAERLPAYAKFKYGYGYVIERMALSLARLTGHTVEGEQDELVVDGIVGHRDAVVDGCILDVKSCSSIQFRKYRDRTVEEDDAFGNLLQLDGYVLGSAGDPLVTIKDRGYILAIDKTLGHMVLYEHIHRERIVRERIKEYKEICGLTEPPSCQCGIVRDKHTARIKLGIKASYSQYKHICFPRLRMEIEKGNPVYYTS